MSTYREKIEKWKGRIERRAAAGEEPREHEAAKLRYYSERAAEKGLDCTTNSKDNWYWRKKATKKWGKKHWKEILDEVIILLA